MIRLDADSAVSRFTIPKPPTSGSMNAVVEPVARRLGMTSEQLAAELRSGKSLDAIAANRGFHTGTWSTPSSKDWSRRNPPDSGLWT
jgi:hypothetical protein